MSTSDAAPPDNFYEDDTRADSYARLEFPGTYYLAFRDRLRVEALMSQFDGLIRAAEVGAHDLPTHLRSLRAEIA